MPLRFVVKILWGELWGEVVGLWGKSVGCGSWGRLWGRGVLDFPLPHSSPTTPHGLIGSEPHS